MEGPLAESGHKVAANHSFSAIVKENKIELALLHELHEDVPEEPPAIDEIEILWLSIDTVSVQFHNNEPYSAGASGCVRR